MENLQGTFLREDVTILLKDLSYTKKAVSLETREALIKAGKNAYDTIPFETAPCERDLYFYEIALKLSIDDVANAVKALAEQIYLKKGNDVVLVSLIRGGITTGILLKHYLDKKYHLNIPHYALTLIGTKGIDEFSLNYLLNNVKSDKIQFVDGWTGKGAVKNMLDNSLKKYKNIDHSLAVLSDPGNIADVHGTNKDILIPSACLNAPLAGLISRAIPQDNSFFGAIFFDSLIKYDRTYDFIEKVESQFDYTDKAYNLEENTISLGAEETRKIANDFNIENVHFIKPGIGECMRAIIRKKPDIILIKNEKNKYIDFIKDVASSMEIEICEYPLQNYYACGIYKNCNSDIL